MEMVPRWSRPGIPAPTQKRNTPAPLCSPVLAPPAVSILAQDTAARASLGTTAKLSATSLCSDPETGEIRPAKGAYDPHKAGADRLALQDVVARLLPNSRTAKCERVVSGIKGSGGKVEVRQ